MIIYDQMLSHSYYTVTVVNKKINTLHLDEQLPDRLQGHVPVFQQRQIFCILVCLCLWSVNMDNRSLYNDNMIISHLQLTPKQLAGFWQILERHVLVSPHCLPVSLRIDLKILLITFKALHGLASYIAELLLPYEPEHSLRLSGRGLVPKFQLKTKDDRGFCSRKPSALELSAWRSKAYRISDIF